MPQYFDDRGIYIDEFVAWRGPVPASSATSPALGPVPEMPEHPANARHAAPANRMRAIIRKALGIHGLFRIEPISYHSQGRAATPRSFPNDLFRTMCPKSHNGPVCLNRSSDSKSGMAARFGAAASHCWRRKESRSGGCRSRLETQLIRLSEFPRPALKPVAKTHRQCSIQARSRSDLASIENRRPVQAPVTKIRRQLCEMPV